LSAPKTECAVALAVHGHFYQPPRENPWTEEVPREPTAAPFHDWNERIALEAYRPNAFARIVDDHGRVVQIVNNYEHISFDVGPTLTAWLAEHEPEAMARIVEADAKTQGGVAQAYFHVILPLATERDVRTLVRWGLAEFEHRFGRRADGIWLPETAVSDSVLRVLATEGVGFTILAPYQADRPIDPRRAYRWQDPEHAEHPEDATKGVDLVFYDGGLSHAVAFELASLSSEGFVDRAIGAAPDGGLVAVAADGETFGHHHSYGDRFLAYALVAEAPKRHVEVTSVGAWLRDGHHRPAETVGVVTSAWSCAHGVGRWMEDCGCATGGQPGWDQRWRAPLRRALDVVRDAVDEVYERRGAIVFGDRDAARDEYVRVLLGSMERETFADRHVVGEKDRDKDEVEAFTLLEAARHALAMYTSCGWFFNDLAGLETVQVLRYAARAMDLLDELGESGEQGELLDRFLHELGEAGSNVAHEGTGRDVWRRHVETARVTEDRVVAHLALMELLEGHDPAVTIGAFDVEVLDHGHADRGAVAMCSGKVRLTHRRTGRRTSHVYAAVRLGGLEVVGATRPAADDGHDGDGERADREALDRFRSAFEFDAPVTTLVRLVSEGFGPHEFGVASGLPDAAGQLLHSAARRLSDRFSATYEQLYNDHRSTLTALAAAGYQLPAELRAPAELALTRRLEAEVAAQAGSLDPADYVTAISIARDARANGVSLDTARARATMERLLVAAVRHAVEHPDAPDSAFAALDICEELEIHPPLDQAQEIVYEAVHEADGDAPPALRRLAARLGLAP